MPRGCAERVCRHRLAGAQATQPVRSQTGIASRADAHTTLPAPTTQPNLAQGSTSPQTTQLAFLPNMSSSATRPPIHTAPPFPHKHTPSKPTSQPAAQSSPWPLHHRSPKMSSSATRPPIHTSRRASICLRLMLVWSSSGSCVTMPSAMPLQHTSTHQHTILTV